MKHSKSSKRWLKEHFDDEYVKRAQRDGYRSRAVYKLLELQEKDRMIKPGMIVVDLGAAPGGWSQLAIKLLGKKGEVYALDILPMDDIPGVNFIEGDFREEEVLNQLLNAIGGQKVDIVLSDMAPNVSGMKAVDQPRAMYLAELALECAERILKPDGVFLVKVFQGTGIEEYIKNVRGKFKTLTTRKPKASRDRSRETYFLARGYKG